MKTIKAMHSKGARELVVIRSEDFRWLLALAREKEDAAGPITVEARTMQIFGSATLTILLPRLGVDWLLAVDDAPKA